MKIVRFLPRHLLDLHLQRAQSAFRDTILKPEYGTALALAGPCFTVTLNDWPVACGGAQEFHPKRAEMWGLLSRDSRPLMRQMTRAIVGWMEQCPYDRLEINVATDFDAGHRWARMLGFKVEGPEKLAYSPDGRGAIPYVRLK